MTPDAIAYLRDRAQKAGYNADDLLKVINYESSGRPDVWGGKGGKYFGLIQFGEPERKQFGVDTVHPNAQNQIDATFRYLDARGFKPGMGLMDLYSTVLAGSPGHYNRSDGAGTVAQHVGKMGGKAMPQSADMPMAYAAAEPAAPTTINDLLQQPAAQPMQRGLLGLRQAVQELEREDAPATYDDEMKRQMVEMHRQIHEQSVAGLLGRI
jgi:hypothetical protein